jgi:zeaxanthin glucosyltransferase
MARMTSMLCCEAPAQLEALDIEMVVCDQLEAAGGLIARRMGLPCVSVANALMIEREPYVPPPFTPWAYARTRWARERNLGGYRVSDWMMQPLAKVISYWAKRWRLRDAAHLQRVNQCVGALQIGQLVHALATGCTAGRGCCTCCTSD